MCNVNLLWMTAKESCTLYMALHQYLDALYVCISLSLPSNLFSWTFWQWPEVDVQMKAAAKIVKKNVTFNDVQKRNDGRRRIVHFYCAEFARIWKRCVCGSWEYMWVRSGRNELQVRYAENSLLLESCCFGGTKCSVSNRCLWSMRNYDFSRAKKRKSSIHSSALSKYLINSFVVRSYIWSRHQHAVD